MRRTRLIGGIVLLLGLAWMGGAQAGAQDDDDNAALDAVRALIPEGEPGEYDLTEADTVYGQLADAYGASGVVDDFGDGSKLTGVCGGFAYSYDEDGELLDAAADFGDDNPPVDLLDGGQAFTTGNRFKVDTRGVVVYYGFMPRDGDGPLDHEWDIKTSGISLDSGGDPNVDAKNRNSGLVDLDEDLPVKFSANAKVKGELTSANIGNCEGEGHVEFIGNGLADPVGIAAIALFAGGLLGLLFNARPAKTWKEG
ncbi:MAG TPA: hypothetical protein VFV63_05925 [Ilumatobacteraceae bacterium]|nr:hypothetical protein [Ilumatobacteraceae bacterium]